MSTRRLVLTRSAAAVGTAFTGMLPGIARAALSKEQIVDLYVAYFGRPPDYGGMNWYLSQPNATIDSVAQAFSDSPESKALYGNTFGAAQVDAIYMNVFNRHAEPAGVNYWTGEVNAGHISPAKAAWAILVGGQGNDGISVNNKRLMATAWFDSLNTSARRTKYSGTAAANVARDFLRRVHFSSQSLAVGQATLQQTLDVMMVAYDASQVGGVNWQDLGYLEGMSDDHHYTPIVHTPHPTLKGLRAYSNAQAPDGQSARLDLYDCAYPYLGGYAAVGPAKAALTVTSSADDYIRTSGVCRGDITGKHYALLYTGSSYPTTGGYSPSFATSNDGVTWSWQGSAVTPFGRIQSSAANLIVDEARTDVGDDYRFMAWLDALGKVKMIHSKDGKTWIEGPAAWPSAVQNDSAWQFVTACKTPHGYHLIGAHNFPATEHRHLFSVDGKTWKVVELAARTMTSHKGTNLSYDPKTGYVIALTAGYLFRFAAKPF